jgi:mRNA interferase RelE/StbE
MAYRVEIRPAAYRALESLSPSLQSRIAAKIDALAQNPYPPGVKKLAGAEKRLRIRVGDYRIVYDIQSEVLLILVIRIGHRREVYR